MSKLPSLLTAALGMIACIAMGGIAAGLLYDEYEEHHPILAGLLFLVALLAAVGTLFFLFRLLKQIAPKR